jgi:hypothetical protein
MRVQALVKKLFRISRINYEGSIGLYFNSNLTKS